MNKIKNIRSFILALFGLCSSPLICQVGIIEKWKPGSDELSMQGYAIGLDSQKKIYFVKANYIEKYGNFIDNIYYSTKESDDNWSNPAALLPPINDDFNNSVVGVANGGNTIYLLSNYNKSWRARVGLSKCKLLESGYWSKPEPVKLRGLNPKTEYYSFYVTPDESMVLATFQRSKKQSDDLYYSMFNEQKNRFDKLQSLGPNINSSGSEISPFISQDLSTLYFSRLSDKSDSSNYDIFFSKRLDATFNNWSMPEPFNAINSPGFDAYYWCCVDSLAFFTSDADNYGKTDILSFQTTSKAKEDPRKGMKKARAFEVAEIKDKGSRPEIILNPTEMLIDMVDGRFDTSKYVISGRVLDNKNHVPNMISSIKATNNEGLVIATTETDSGSRFSMELPSDEKIHFTVDNRNQDNTRIEFYNKTDSPRENLAINKAGDYVFERIASEKKAIRDLEASGRNLENIVSAEPANQEKTSRDETSLESEFLFVENNSDASGEDSKNSFGMRGILYSDSDQPLKAGTEVAIVNKFGQEIGHTTLNDESYFEFHDIDMEDGFELKVLDESVASPKVGLINNNGQQAEVIEVAELENFVYKKLSAERSTIARMREADGPNNNLDKWKATPSLIEKDLKKLESEFLFVENNSDASGEESKNSFGMRGILYSDSDQPLKAGTEVAIVNKFGQEIGHTTLNDESYFEFHDIDMEDGFELKVLDESVASPKVGLINNNGQQAEVIEVAELENFVYKKLSSEKATISVMRELDVAGRSLDALSSRFLSLIETSASDNADAQELKLIVIDEKGKPAGSGVKISGYDMNGKKLMNAQSDVNSRLTIKSVSGDVKSFSFDNSSQPLSLIVESGAEQDKIEIADLATYLKVQQDAAESNKEIAAKLENLSASNIAAVTEEIKSDVFLIDNSAKAEANTYNISGLLLDGNNEPLGPGLKVEMIDEKGNVVRTACTDNESKINFNDIGLGEKFDYRIDIEKNTDVQIALLDKNGNVKEKILLKELKAFVYQKLKRESTSVKLLAELDVAGRDLGGLFDKLATIESKPLAGSSNAIANAAEPKAEQALKTEENLTGAKTSTDISSQIDLELFFGFGSSELSSQAQQQLKMISGKNINKIVGYTDTIGPRTFNAKLSQMRAVSITSSLDEIKANCEITAGGELEGPPQASRKVVLSYAPDNSGAIKLNYLVYHKLNQVEFEEEYSRSVSNLCEYLISHPGFTVTIVSHADARGSEDYNLNLSKNRADYVESFLLKSGVKKSSISIEFKGEKETISGCKGDIHCSESQYILDRRTEIIMSRKN